MVRFIAMYGQERGFSFKKTTRHMILIKEGIKDLTASRKELEALMEDVEKNIAVPQ